MAFQKIDIFFNKKVFKASGTTAERSSGQNGGNKDLWVKSKE